MSLPARRVPVSVVIPCWRAGETIARAVASVAGQSVLPSEVILVDDASGDGTAEALRSLAAQYPDGWIRIVCLRENLGPGGARNVAWESARQPWLAFLDADDAWHPQKLSLQWRLHETWPDLVLSGHETALAKPSWEGATMPSNPAVRRVGFWAMLVSNRFPTRSVMLRRDIPFRFEGRDVTEDYLLWLRVIRSGRAGAVLRAPLAVSFRPDFSPGGWSGQLWRHERRELRAWRRLRELGALSMGVWALASLWSLVKYLRRELMTRWGR